MIRISALLLAAVVLSSFENVQAQGRRFKPKPPGVPSELQVTPYKTTMIANGNAQTLITVNIIDSKGDVLSKAEVVATFIEIGDASVVRVTGDWPNTQQIALTKLSDSTGS